MREEFDWFIKQRFSCRFDELGMVFPCDLDLAWQAATAKQAEKIAILREALENWSQVIAYQYTGSKEAMSFLQNADNQGQKAREKAK